MRAHRCHQEADSCLGRAVGRDRRRGAPIRIPYSGLARSKKKLSPRLRPGTANLWAQQLADMWRAPHLAGPAGVGAISISRVSLHSLGQTGRMQPDINN